MSDHPIITSALKSIQMQAASIAGLASFVDSSFQNAVQLLSNSKGRLVISGIGKSAIVAQKIVATMNSTGTPALFMHAADAIHGDLGMVQPADVVMVISKSGDSPEIKVLAPLLKNFGNTLIGMVGNMQSYLASQSDIVINTTVTQEACPNNLAPTTSTTAQMVMGDALAVCLMEARGFKSTDFARYHPGGALGKRLLVHVADVMRQGEAVPQVAETALVREAILEISRKGMGMTAVLNAQGQVTGVYTDGDLRRGLDQGLDIRATPVQQVMTHQPRYITANKLGVEAVKLMQDAKVYALLVLDDQQRLLGAVSMHDLMRAGIV